MNLGAIHLAEATGAQPFTTGNLLTALLTAESLVFAAISVSVSVGGKQAFGVKPFPSVRALGVLATFAIVFVAIGAGLIWFELFGGERWPGGASARVGVVALVSVIGVQPLLAIGMIAGLFR